MNRKAKRNKFKKLQRKYESTLALFDARTKFEHCFSKEVKVKRISCFKPIEEFARLPKEKIKEIYQKEVANQIAEEILKHEEIMTVTDTGYGYRYDFQFVENEVKK